MARVEDNMQPAPEDLQPTEDSTIPDGTTPDGTTPA